MQLPLEFKIYKETLMDPVSNDTQPLLGETTLTPPNSGASLLARTRKKVGEALAWGGISIGGGAVGGAGVMYFAGTAALSLPTGGAALLGAALPPAAVALYRRVVAEKENLLQTLKN